MKVAFYDTKPYDRASFEPLGEANQIRFKFFEDKLTEVRYEIESITGQQKLYDNQVAHADRKSVQ